MKKADASDIALVPETFAKAGETLKKLNEGVVPDLAACADVASVLSRIRTKEGFEKLDDQVQGKLRTAAASVNARFSRDDNMLLHFFSEAFGATRRPEKAEPVRRERIGTFLLVFASA